MNTELYRIANRHSPYGCVYLESFDVDVIRSQTIANYYDVAESRPNDELVKRAWKALNMETYQIADKLERCGYRIIPTSRAETYRNVAEMALDAVESRSLRIWTGGVPEHSLMTPGENMRFRFVHDLFGHAMIDAQFGHYGEEQAYRVHYQMYSDLARKALATETRGQNCALHFGRAAVAVDNNGFGAQFAEQKAFIMPEELRRID